jgi:hypothetical protein
VLFRKAQNKEQRVFVDLQESVARGAFILFGKELV